MNWILIAIISGMVMTSSHDTEEQCLGRKAMLEKDKVAYNAKCINMAPNYGNYGTVTTLGGAWSQPNAR